MKKINYDTYEKPTDYLKISEGVRTIRILTDGYLVRTHGKKMGGRYIPFICTEDGKCPHCASGDKSKLEYRWIVFDYKTSSPKLLTVSGNLGDILAKFIKENGGDVSYDIEITRTGSGMKDTKYSVKKADVSKDWSKAPIATINASRDYLVAKYF